ncbi:energy-coupling factor transporter transmembrane protein EcfT [Saxibacter everestensis]|uniref:Energy-coupling factor transporter transmembrane protein EcfT n=1 Tax=Saxibacter everestensis TaxID=2909229 RepID=A0ABY8QVN3_9MICO|nr:energy-coupling factor transporter transmembrane protein EcfT [Brevibacteriaceae bacterium ZFBP1038]
MTHRSALLGRYVQGNSWLHRAPVWSKLLGIAVFSLVVFLHEGVWLSLGLLILAAAAGLSSGVRSTMLLVPLALLWPVLLLLFGYHWWLQGPLAAAQIVIDIVSVVLTASLITLTTPSQRLLDALVAMARPLRPLGADPERFGLSVGLMIRSVPHLIGLGHQVRDSAKARGLERNPRAVLLPVVVNAVAYAQATGDALAARGLGERDDGSA